MRKSVHISGSEDLLTEPIKLGHVATVPPKPLQLQKGGGKPEPCTLFLRHPPVLLYLALQAEKRVTLWETLLTR